MKNNNSIEHVSDTAYWVATYRALETRRPDALFQDPLAEVLLGEKGQQVYRIMKSTKKYASWSIIMRTRLIDDYIKELVRNGCQTIINLGAGLDTRPYRLDLPKNLNWVEIDFPHVIETKTEKLKGHAPLFNLERIALDLSNPEARQKTLADLNTRYQSIVVLTEGVIPYLSESMVSELAADLYAQSEIRYWVAEYYAPKLYPFFQSEKFKKRLGGAPFQFFPEDWFSIFNQQGWKLNERRYLYDIGQEHQRPFPLPWWLTPVRWIAPPDRLAQNLRLQGYVILDKKK